MENTNEVALRTPTPYISFATFSNALTSLTEHGIPSQIDRSVLKQFSGFNQNLIFHAFRFMGFTNEKDEPTDDLHHYAAVSQEDRKGLLGDLLKKRYPEQVKILANGTSQRLNESFNDLNVESSVKKKCVSFFLQMAKTAELPISVHILKSSRTRGPRFEGGRKRSMARVQRGENAAKRNSTEEPSSVPQGMISVPIAVGIGKTWSIMIERTPQQQEKERFVQMVKLALGV